MKTAALALAASLLLLAGARGADWRAGLTDATPGRFPAVPQAEAFYDFGWSGITAAQGSLAFSRPKPGLSELELAAHTTGMARTLWRLDARTLSFCDSKALRPIRVRQAEEYRGSTSLTAQEFSPEGVLRSKGSTPGKPKPEFFANVPADRKQLRALTGKKAKFFKFPNVFDLQTALLFLRSQPLADGDVIRMVIHQDNSPYLATIRVAGRETVEVPAGKFPAIRLELKLQWVDDRKDPLILRPHTRFKRAFGWLSDDANRLPVKLQADIFVGSIWAELTRLNQGNSRR